MSVWTGIVTILGLIIAATFAIGMLLVGAGMIWLVYACTELDDPTTRFVVGVDFGKRYNDFMESVADDLHRTVELTEQAYSVVLPKDEESEEETEEFE